MKIATRSAAISALVAAGITQAFAKVFVKEKFDRDDDNKPTDELHSFDGEKVRKIEIEESDLKAQADEFIGGFVDIKNGNISVWGEEKYDIKGDVLHPELDHIPEPPENKVAEPVTE